MGLEIDTELVFEAIEDCSTRRRQSRINPAVHALNLSQSRKKQRRFAAGVKAREKDNRGAHGLGYATIEEINERLPSGCRIFSSGMGLWIGGPYRDPRVTKRITNLGFLKGERVEYHPTQEMSGQKRRMREKERSVARVAEAKAMAKAISKAQARRKELRAPEEARQAEKRLVEAKAEAETNPDDPISWLRMAFAADATNRHEEAERCRKTAIELIEKKTP